MGICPVCNGLREIYLICSYCGNPMMESGRLQDFYDDYSPYMEIDLMKLEDGYGDNYSGHRCPHLYRCPSCHKEEIILVKE